MPLNQSPISPSLLKLAKIGRNIFAMPLSGFALSH